MLNHQYIFVTSLLKLFKQILFFYKNFSPKNEKWFKLVENKKKKINNIKKHGYLSFLLFSLYMCERERERVSVREREEDECSFVSRVKWSL